LVTKQDFIWIVNEQISIQKYKLSKLISTKYLSTRNWNIKNLYKKEASEIHLKLKKQFLNQSSHKEREESSVTKNIKNL
jgi:hypothetical protein